MKGKRNALGKGLSALLESAETDVTSKIGSTGSPAVVGSVSEIAMTSIEANPFQPRNEFELEALEQLSESIKEQGIIQPITVRKLGYDKYQIISGERRFRASKLAGLKTIPAYIRIANDQAMLEMALVENIQRSDLNPLEVGISYKRLIDECNLSQEELAQRVGKKRSTVTNYMRLLKLPPQIQTALKENRITMGHARSILGLDSISAQLQLYKDILENNFSVRDTELKVSKARGTKKKKSKTYTDPNIKALEKKMSDNLETRVNIHQKSRDKGTITIDYFSADDLERISSFLSD
ncbi:MAG: ParB/RepB/Spo0J family partition protein [Bacteroidia bacterium]|nr:ParB/RepB/Spo0J family partition protein [Bacteroidia bacterium]